LFKYKCIRFKRRVQNNSPIYEKGENLSFSIGGKYTYRKNFLEGKNYYYGAEAGLYFFAGMIGLQYTHNFETKTKYNISFYIKYF
jgi:hypothetical protein